MGFWIPNGSKINPKQKRNFYPTMKHSCRQEVDLAPVDGNPTNWQMMGALLYTVKIANFRQILMSSLSHLVCFYHYTISLKRNAQWYISILPLAFLTFASKSWQPLLSAYRTNYPPHIRVVWTAYFWTLPYVITTTWPGSGSETLGTGGD